MPAIIPMRPKTGKFNLKSEEMLGLNWYVLSGCSREDAFLKFVRPDFIGSKAQTAIKAAVSQFFSTKEVQEYMSAYKDTILGLSSSKPTDEGNKGGSLEERKAKAKIKATEFAISMADNIEEASDPEFVLKLMDKVGLLDQEEEVEELPRRYLPVSCSSCEYRKFVEENCDIVEDGTVLEEESNR